MLLSRCLLPCLAELRPRDRLLSQIRPAVWFAAQLCTAGSAQPGDGKTWVGAWRGGSLASCPRHREPVAGCVSLPSNSQHTSPFLCPLCPLPLPLLAPAAKGTWEPWHVAPWGLSLHRLQAHESHRAGPWPQCLCSSAE